MRRARFRARLGWNVAVAGWALASVVVAMPATAVTDAGEAGATESVPPTILWVAAGPSSIAGGTTTTLHWNAPGATSASIAPGVGTVPARGSVSVAPGATTTYTLTAGNGGGSTTKSVTVRVGPYPTSAPLRAVHMVTPLGGQRFTAPASLRLFASASNGFVDSGCGSDGNAQGCADRVDFYVDDQVVAQVPKTQSEYSVFKANVAGIAAGAHRVWARGIYTDPRGPMQTLDSEAMGIVVDPPPPYANTVSLSGDVVLAGSQNYELVGAPGARIRLEGNGHRILSTSSWSGTLRLVDVDVFGFGQLAHPDAGIAVSTSGSVQVERCVFEATNALSLTLRGSAGAVVRGNQFRSNMFMIEAQQPTYTADRSYPAVELAGPSTAPKVFQANNVGLGWVDLAGVDNWLVGGDQPEHGNVVMGARAGISVQSSSRVVVRGNLSYHVYYGGWSQGNNFELDGSEDILVEHNVIGGGSWPIRGLGGELRGNLVLDAGHQWLWITDSGARVHHNVFADGEGDVAGIWLIYQPQDVEVYNNTLDGFGNPEFIRPALVGGGSIGSLRSNAFVGFRRRPAVQVDGTVDADHNLFFGQQSNPQNYSDDRHPQHDVGGLNAQVEPQLTGPIEPFRFGWTDLWTRAVTVRQVLASYRADYTPAAGSPLLGAGDPAVAPGNNVGAVGNGDATDVFGNPGAGFADGFERGNTGAWAGAYGGG